MATREAESDRGSVSRISEAAIGVVIFAIILVGVWKLAQLIWAAFSG